MKLKASPDGRYSTLFLTHILSSLCFNSSGIILVYQRFACSGHTTDWTMRKYLELKIRWRGKELLEMMSDLMSDASRGL